MAVDSAQCGGLARKILSVKQDVENKTSTSSKAWGERIKGVLNERTELPQTSEFLMHTFVGVGTAQLTLGARHFARKYVY